MPELPEVETVRSQLEKVIIGKSITQIHVLKDKSWTGEISQVVNQPIVSVERRSKVLIIRLQNGFNLLVHLKMSGQLIYVDGEFRTGGGHPTDDWVQQLPSKHTRIVFTFDDGTTLFFNDQRMFGWVRVMSVEETTQSLSSLAPDVIDHRITAEYLFEKARRRSIPVKQFIMDNQIVAGVGNIYACDALNRARVSPTRSVSTLTQSEVNTLLDAMREVIHKGIELGGATAHGKYVDVAGLAGRYQNVMRVYNKKGESCPNCGSPIEKTKLGGRGTYFCPSCQK